MSSRGARTVTSASDGGNVRDPLGLDLKRRAVFDGPGDMGRVSGKALCGSAVNQELRNSVTSQGPPDCFSRVAIPCSSISTVSLQLKGNWPTGGVAMNLRAVMGVSACGMASRRRPETHRVMA